jgi:hypothetical protein
LPVDRLDADQIIDLIGPAYSEDKASVTRAEVRFTDDMGRRWTFEHAGRPTEVIEEPPPSDGPPTAV